MPSAQKLFLGLDCSTQSFKAVVTKAGSSEVLLAAQVNFDDELGQSYEIKGGMTR
jgi:sugar (pentulose or hexulose) kinase